MAFKYRRWCSVALAYQLLPVKIPATFRFYNVIRIKSGNRKVLDYIHRFDVYAYCSIKSLNVLDAKLFHLQRDYRYVFIVNVVCYDIFL